MANSTDFTGINTPAMTLAVQGKAVDTVSTLFDSLPILAILALTSNQKSDAILGVGDPSAETVLAGAELSKSTIRQIQQFGTYSPLIHAIRQHDHKWMDWFDSTGTASAHTGSAATFSITTDANGTITAVAVSGGGSGYSGAAPTLVAVDAPGSCGYGADLVATVTSGAIASVEVRNGGVGYGASASIIIYAGNSADQKYKRPVFKWSELETTIRVQKRSIDSVIQANQNAPKLLKEGILDLVGDAVKDGLAGHATEIAQQLWTGTPSDETADIYDEPFGLLAAIDDGSNTTSYAGVDRTIAANYWWRSKVDNTAYTWGLSEMVEDANYKKGLAFKDGEVNCFIVHPFKFAKLRSQQVSQVQEVNLNKELTGVLKTGSRMAALRYGNTFVVPDPRCPLKTVLGINLKSVIVAFKNGKKFTPGPMRDQSIIDGNDRVFSAKINTQIMPMVVAPALNIKYTNVS